MSTAWTRLRTASAPAPRKKVSTSLCLTKRASDSSATRPVLRDSSATRPGGGGGGGGANASAASTRAEKRDPPESALFSAAPGFEKKSSPAASNKHDAPSSTVARGSSVPRTTNASRRGVWTNGDFFGRDKRKGGDGARGARESARRAARRDALQREVTALQQLKLRLEDVHDALVRKASGARANVEGKEDER